MAIPDRVSKNRSNLEANIPGRVGLDVVAPTNVRAQQTDPSNVTAFLNQWTAIQARKEEKTRADVAALAGAEGQRDASLGRVDESRMEGDSPGAVAYRKGAAEIRSEAHGLRFITQAREELAREASRPDFDYEAWRTAKFDEFYSSSAEGQNPDGLETLNRMAAQFEQNTRAQYSAIRAKADNDRATEGLADNLQAMLQAGMTTPAQVAAWRSTRAANSGLEDDEIDDVVGSVLLDRLAQGDTNAYALAESSGLLKQFQWSGRFTDQRAATDARLERERIDALEGDARRTMEVRRQLSTMADRGQLTVSYLADQEQRGLITPAERNRAWEEQLQVQARRVEESRKALEAVQEQARFDALSRAGKETIWRETAGDPTTRRKVRESMDRQYAAGLTDALSNDPEVKARGVAEMGRVLDQAQANDMKLEYVAAAFDGADIHIPERFESIAMLYRDLVAQGKGDYLANNISARAQARFTRFDFLVNSGQTPTQARESMARAPVSYDDALALSRFNGRAIQVQAEKTAAALGVSPGVLLPTLQNFATELYAQGALGEAPTQAAEMVTSRYAAVDGQLVRRSWFPDPSNPREPEEFAEAWGAVKDAVILPKLRERFGDDVDDVQPVPDPNVPGQFLLMVPGVGLVPDAAVTSGDVVKAHLQRKREAAVKLQGANRDFVDRALPPL